jgi:hypothetical protein
MPRARRPSVRPQPFDDGRPGRVELRGGRCRAPSRDQVGLLDQRDAEVLLERSAARRHQVRRGHPAAGAVAEHERACGTGGLL